MTPIVMLGKEIFQPASKELLKQLKKWGAKVIPKKEVTPEVKAKAKTVTKENISDQHPGKIRKIPPEQRSMSEAQMRKAVKEGGVPRYDTTKPIPRLGKTPVGGKLTAGEPRGALDRAKEGVKRPEIKKRKGGPIKGKPVNGIKRAGKPVNGIKGMQVAKADGWSRLSEAEKAAILGLTTRGAGGIRKHSKKKKKPTKVRKANRGGMTGEGLYPAEEARSGTMSQVRRKKYMKKGGKVISYKMTGGQVVDAGYD